MEQKDALEFSDSRPDMDSTGVLLELVEGERQGVDKVPGGWGDHRAKCHAFHDAIVDVSELL